VDNDGNTAGDVSLSLNDEESYRAVRDAGIRSGVFFPCLPCLMALYSIYAELILQLLSSRGEESDTLVLREVDDTALCSTEKFLSSRLKYTTDVHGQEICLLQDGDAEIGVMMGWERGISAFCFLSPWFVCLRAIVILSA